MNYIELINNFWSVRRIRPMTSYEADFYFYLLKECNSRNWTNPFELPSRNVELELGISRKTICDLRNKLQQKGLISFREGQKRASGAFYFILYVSDGNKSGNENGNVNGNVNGNENGNPLYKQKHKHKNIDNNSSELFAQIDVKPKKAVRTKKEFVPPTFEEVSAYFENKMPDWRKQAEIFYNHFTSLGWRTASGVRIERWDSRANNWIMKEKENGDGKNRKPSKADKARELLDEFAAVTAGGENNFVEPVLPDL